MAIQIKSSLKTRANVISNETVASANTKLRIGSLYDDIIDSFIHDDDVSVKTAHIQVSKPVREGINEADGYTRLQDFGAGFNKTGRLITLEETLLSSDDFQLINNVVYLKNSTNVPLSEYSTLLGGIMFSYSMRNTGTLVDDLGVLNGTNNNITQIAGPTGGMLAYGYNGTNAYSQVPFNAAMNSATNAITLMGDFFRSGGGQSFSSIIGAKFRSGSSSATSYRLSLNANNQILFSILLSNGTNQDWGLSPVVPLNTWVRVVCRWQQGSFQTMETLINGNFQGFYSAVRPDLPLLVESGGNITIGGAPDTPTGGQPNRFLQGGVQTFIGWNRYLTDPEVTDLLNGNYITYNDF